MKRSYLKRTPNKKRKLAKIADRLWFELLIKPKCEICPAEAIQVHHYYFKGNYGHIRYDLNNGISLCRGHHSVLHWQDAKKIEEQIVEKRGTKWFYQLQKKSRERPVSYQTIEWYNGIIEGLKKEHPVKDAGVEKLH